MQLHTKLIIINMLSWKEVHFKLSIRTVPSGKNEADTVSRSLALYWSIGLLCFQFGQRELVCSSGRKRVSVYF